MSGHATLVCVYRDLAPWPALGDDAVHKRRQLSPTKPVSAAKLRSLEPNTLTTTRHLAPMVCQPRDPDEGLRRQTAKLNVAAKVTHAK